MKQVRELEGCTFKPKIREYVAKQKELRLSSKTEDKKVEEVPEKKVDKEEWKRV